MLTDEEERTDRIDELDGDDVPPAKMSKMGNGSPEKSTTGNFVQAPVIPCVFTDPETKRDRCVVVLILYGGVSGINVDVIASVDGPGQVLKVTYEWPSSMYDMTSMFKNQKGEMLTQISHPRVQAVEKALKNYRNNIEEAPIASFEVKLPIDVELDPETWSKIYSKKDDGGVIVFLEFNGIRKDYVIAKKEKFLKIE